MDRKQETHAEVQVPSSPVTYAQNQVKVASPYIIGALTIYGAAKGLKSSLVRGYDKFKRKRHALKDVKEMVKEGKIDEALEERLETIKEKGGLELIQGGKD